MRFKSKTVNNYCIYAVSGTNTVSFGIDYEKADTKGLLGFSVKRTYPDGQEHYMPGFKVFEANKGKVIPPAFVSTETDPVQSFVWDDFTLKPETEYTYTFIPVKGTPEKLLQQSPIRIKIKTEPTFSNQEHDIFFNRGVASSQAYAREFGNISPDLLVGKKQQDAFKWLTRDLETALITFIRQAKKGETLLGCFYEFNYAGVLDEFKKAIDNGVKVTLIIDAKNNEHPVKDKKTGKSHMAESSPRVQTLAALKLAKIPKANYILREANKNLIQHNKFIVYLKGAKKIPTAVWTGSTNVTESGIFGQTNVGHWVRNPALAVQYKAYWDLLSKDPGAKDNDTPADRKKGNKDYISQLMKIQKDVAGTIPAGVTPIFSPRDSLAMLTKYFSLIDTAKNVSNITLAFGITAELKDLLLKHSGNSPTTFMMLEKPDAANSRSKAAFVPLTVKNNVYQAFGSFLRDPLYNWVKESNTKIMQITAFVNYIHSKFLIQDPLDPDPVVVTRSANFSPPSTIGNDENMIIIRGDIRTPDIYFTQFTRIFHHYS